VTFYLDEDLAPQVAARLRKMGLDAVSALEAGNAQLSDRDQLRFAARQGRCLVTRNARHVVLLAQAAIRHPDPHAGIVLCSPRFRGFEIGKIASALMRLARQFPEEFGPYDVVYL
jgi:predicted nuclease of predicted toxin-antitoxin system